MVGDAPQNDGILAEEHFPPVFVTARSTCWTKTEESNEGAPEQSGEVEEEGWVEPWIIRVSKEEGMNAVN